MRELGKVCACLIRLGAGGPELLVFDHPYAGTQIPKGTVEPGEDNGVAVLRELEEETGVWQAAITRSLGTWERVVGAGPQETGEPERHVWEVFELHPTAALPEAWQHEAEGSEQERGLVFGCRWIPLDSSTADTLMDLFGPVVAMLLEHPTVR